jgi:hypothetical protein
MNGNREGMRAVLTSVIENFRTDTPVCVDMILRLFESPTRAQPEHNTEGTQQPARRTRIRPPPPLAPPPARQLTSFEWYTLVETEVFLGLGNQRVRNIIREQSDTLITKREIPAGGTSERIMIKGASIIQLRRDRRKMASGAEGDSEGANGGTVDDESAATRLQDHGCS